MTWSLYEMFSKAKQKNMFVSGYMAFQNRNGRWDFLFCSKFYMEIIGKQYVRMGKSHEVLKKLGAVVKN